MATEKQISANRLNAQKSTGPISEEGKAVVAANAIKHGILCNAVLIPDEDKILFAEFQNKLWLGLNPIGEMEEFTAERIIAYAWRLRRIFQVEAYALGKESMKLSFGEKKSLEQEVSERFIRNPPAMVVLSRYEAGIERALSRSIQELDRLRMTRGKSVDLNLDAV